MGQTNSRPPWQVAAQGDLVGEWLGGGSGSVGVINSSGLYMAPTTLPRQHRHGDSGERRQLGAVRISVSTIVNPQPAVSRFRPPLLLLGSANTKVTVTVRDLPTGQSWCWRHRAAHAILESTALTATILLPCWRRRECAGTCDDTGPGVDEFRG